MGDNREDDGDNISSELVDRRLKVSYKMTR